ncbi:MAG: MFS transporter, partial [Anaerolineales bacterium]|nr:MFS transporter [Anaerolineales bacterium]
AEIQAQVVANYRWNFSVNVADGAFFWFGASFISSTTIVPLFVNKLTDSPFLIGLVAVIAQGAFYAPQLLTAPYVERLPRKKPVVVNVGLLTERLPMLILIVAAMLAGRYAPLALLLFFLGYAWHYIGAGMIAVAWQEMIARIFPVDRRGRYFGTSTFIGAGSGALAASASSWLLEQYAFPTNFVILFSIATVGIFLSWIFIALTREPVTPPEETGVNRHNYWAELPRILRQDHNYRRFLVARLTLGLGNLGSGFVTVAAISKFAVRDGTVGQYTVVILIGQTLSNLVLGLLADKYGHKRSLEIAALSAMAAAAIAWLAPGPNWYFLVFFLLGITFGGTVVSGLLIALEFSSPEKRPTYIGLTNSSVGLISAIAPLLGAALAKVSFDLLFGLACVINVVAFLLFHFRVLEPRDLEQKTAAEQ